MISNYVFHLQDQEANCKTPQNQSACFKENIFKGEYILSRPHEIVEALFNFENAGF